MKKIILSFIIILSSLSISYSQSGWFWQHPKPQGNGLQLVQYLDANSIIGAGRFGTIVKTNDGGTNWQYNYLPGVMSEKYMVFFNTYTGIVAAGSAIIKTTDQGLNWFVLSQYPNNIECMYYININTGYECVNAGTSSYFRKTSNGGINWTSINESLTGIHNEMYFFDSNTGIIIGGPAPQSGYIIRTSNGGLNWSMVMSAGALLITYSMLNSNTGVVGGVSGIFRTTDKGISWNTIYSSTCTCNSIAYADSNTLYASFYQPQASLYKSTNGGFNWTMLYQGMQYFLYSIDFLNANTGVGVGYWGSIQRTTNGGLNWFDNGPFSSLTSIDFSDANTGCAVGEEGILFRTTNGGTIWNPVYFNSQNNFTNIKYLNSVTGILIGKNGFNGIIMRSTNQGANWNVVPGVTSPGLNSMYFIDEYTGFAVGDTGIILKTTSGGNAWNQVNAGVTDRLNSVFFVDNNNGFIGRNNNGVLKTTNGGQDWYIIPLTGYQKSVYFINSNTGFIGSTTDHIFKTTNGGNNWGVQHIESGNNYDIVGIGFVNLSTGYSITNGLGVMFKTTDCGSNWDTMPMNFEESYFCIKFLNNLTGYVLGRGGAILKTTTGGEPIGIQPISSEIPKTFHLSQNYPNPFNPSTKIKFSLPFPSEGGVKAPLSFGEGLGVRLVVYDLLGREITTLINEQLKPGTYEVEWDGTDYPSGIYFYKLSTKAFSETKKMVLIK